MVSIPFKYPRVPSLRRRRQFMGLLLALVALLVLLCCREYRNLRQATVRVDNVMLQDKKTDSALPKENVDELVSYQDISKNTQYIAKLLKVDSQTTDFYMSHNSLGELVSFHSDKPVNELAREFLRAGKAAGDLKLERDDYLDLYGQVWACLLTQVTDQRQKVFLLCIEQKAKDKSEVRILNYDGLDVSP